MVQRTFHFSVFLWRSTQIAAADPTRGHRVVPVWSTLTLSTQTCWQKHHFRRKMTTSSSSSPLLSLSSFHKLETQSGVSLSKTIVSCDMLPMANASTYDDVVMCIWRCINLVWWCGVKMWYASMCERCFSNFGAVCVTLISLHRDKKGEGWRIRVLDLTWPPLPPLPHPSTTITPALHRWPPTMSQSHSSTWQHDLAFVDLR